MKKLTLLMSFSLVVCLVWVPGSQAGACTANGAPLLENRENVGVSNSPITVGAADFLDSYPYFLRLLKKTVG